MTLYAYRILFLVPLFFVALYSAQKGNLNIDVYDDFTKAPLKARIELSSGESISGEGNVTLRDLPAGAYTLVISSAGYNPSTLNDISVVPGQNLSFRVGLTRVQESNVIDEVVIVSKAYKTTAESPLSLRTITSEEVQKNAGSNRDVSKALLSLPGVGTTATFRNDLFIRGGSSSENKFYIDGIEVPVINHFQTQGASGGPRGLITIDFIKDVEFYSGAFPAKRNATLSSLFEFNLKQARKDKMGYKAVLGLDDMQLMMDGPLSKDQSWSGLFSVRKSNLQLLFKTIGLPFLPSYYDTTMKVSKKFKNGNELYFIGLGAIDEFKLNQNAEPTLANLTLIERLPVSPQWNYTFGAGYRHLVENGNWLFTWSRNRLDNKSTKYYRNIETPENLLTKYHSTESENKIRVDRSFRLGDYQLSSGGNVNFANYFNNSNLRIITQEGPVLDLYRSDLNLMQYGLYLQASKKFFDTKLELSAGVRLDGSDYSEKTANPLEKFSPRVSAKYKITDRFALNVNGGLYYMLPSYTALGFIQEGNLVNKGTLEYIQNAQVVGGVELNLKNNLRITAETYYKNYKNYPFSLRNGISLANFGGDFGVVGAEPLDSRGKGETYGFELLMQKRTLNDFYGIASYTFGHSKFSNESGELLPSSWDSRHILSLTAGKYLKRDWNIGARFRLQSALPETPYDLEKSPYVSVWNVANSAVYNYDLLNQQRGNTVHQLDVRVEKKWIFTKWQITFYLDVVNAYGSKSPSRLPVVALERDSQGNGIISNPDAQQSEQQYELNYGQNDRSTPLPYFGLIFDF